MALVGLNQPGGLFGTGLLSGTGGAATRISGAACLCFSFTVSDKVPVNGSSPVMVWYSITPTAYQSAASLIAIAPKDSRDVALIPRLGSAATMGTTETRAAPTHSC